MYILNQGFPSRQEWKCWSVREACFSVTLFRCFMPRFVPTVSLTCSSFQLELKSRDGALSMHILWFHHYSKWLSGNRKMMFIRWSPVWGTRRTSKNVLEYLWFRYEVIQHLIFMSYSEWASQSLSRSYLLSYSNLVLQKPRSLYFFQCFTLSFSALILTPRSYIRKVD